MINLHWLYVMTGAMYVAFAVLSARDRSNRKRFGNAIFWALVAISFWFGDYLGDLGNGILVLAIVGVAGAHLLGRGETISTSIERRIELAKRYGGKLFLPALIIPVTAFFGTLLFNYTPLKETGLIDPKATTLVLLGVGVLIALAVCYAWLRPPVLAPLDEGRRLMDSIGWAAILPQMLAALGAIFAAAGIGDIIGGLAGAAIPHGSVFLAVVVYAVGMALFTIIMGNAFAAFPVMVAAIGVPILIHGAGADPAVIGAVGMLSGFCGTLLTPMAANFNIVPAALLELKDQNGVIRMQVATAIPLFICNVLILYFAGYVWAH
jgi:uncharacterized membrane protein